MGAVVPPDGSGEGGEFQEGGFGEGGRVGEEGAVVGEDAANEGKWGSVGCLPSIKKGERAMVG